MRTRQRMAPEPSHHRLDWQAASLRSVSGQSGKFKQGVSKYGVTTFVCQEDVNGEKLTVKNGGFLVPIFSRFTQSFSRFIRDINGEQKTSRY